MKTLHWLTCIALSALAASALGCGANGHDRAEREATANADATAALAVASSANRTMVNSAPVVVRSKWVELPRLLHARNGHTLTALPDGSLVVVGGLTPDGVALSSVEMLSPGAAAWRDLADLRVARRGHGAALLDDGRLLVIGGAAELSDQAALTSTEMVDLKSGTVAKGPPLVAGRTQMHPLVTPTGETWLVDGSDGYVNASQPQRLPKGAPAFVEVPGTGAMPNTAWVSGSSVVIVESGRSEVIAPIPKFSRWLNAGRTPLQPLVARLEPSVATELSHALPPFGSALSASLGTDAILLGQLSDASWSAWRFNGASQSFSKVAGPPSGFRASRISSAPRGSAVAYGESGTWFFDGKAWTTLESPPTDYWEFRAAITDSALVIVGGNDRNSTLYNGVTDRACSLSLSWPP